MSLAGILSLWNKSEEFEDMVKRIKGSLVNKFWLSGLKTSARSFFISALREETILLLMIPRKTPCKYTRI